MSVLFRPLCSSPSTCCTGCRRPPVQVHGPHARPVWASSPQLGHAHTTRLHGTRTSHSRSGGGRRLLGGVGLPEGAAGRFLRSPLQSARGGLLILPQGVTPAILRFVQFNMCVFVFVYIYVYLKKTRLDRTKLKQMQVPPYSESCGGAVYDARTV